MFVNWTMFVAAYTTIGTIGLFGLVKGVFYFIEALVGDKLDEGDTTLDTLITCLCLSSATSIPLAYWQVYGLPALIRWVGFFVLIAFLYWVMVTQKENKQINKTTEGT